MACLRNKNYRLQNINGVESNILLMWNRRDISNTMLCVCVRLASYLNKCLGRFYTSVVIIDGFQPDVILYRSRVVLQFYVFLTCGQIVWSSILPMGKSSILSIYISLQLYVYFLMSLSKLHLNQLLENTNFKKVLKEVDVRVTLSNRSSWYVLCFYMLSLRATHTWDKSSHGEILELSAIYLASRCVLIQTIISVYRPVVVYVEREVVVQS